MSKLYELIRDDVPDADIVREAVDAVAELPGVSNWAPSDGLGIHRFNIIHWGFRLSRVRGLAGIDAMKSAIAKGILVKGRPLRSDLAELSAAALCVALGAETGHCVPRTTIPTPDWRLRWKNGPQVDVEVTAAATKAGHIERRAIAEEIAKSLSDPSRTDDLILHLADPMSIPESAVFLAHAKTLPPGEILEKSNSWRIERLRIQRGVEEIYEAGKSDPRPAWWPNDGFRMFVLHGIMAGPTSLTAPPQVRVYYGVPLEAYINPVQNKVTSLQADLTAPFLIAVDIGDLPGGFQELTRLIPAHWSIWPHVSGVLLFHDVLSPWKSAWAWRLLANPHAVISLPQPLLDLIPRAGGVLETGIAF